MSLAACALALLSPAAASAATGPAGSDFYNPPAGVPSGHGKLIWKRGAGDYVRLEGAAYTKKVLYTSTAPQGEPIVVSGSVSVPEGDPPPGGWPVISWGHSTTGVADRCAPSSIGERTPFLDEVSYVDPVQEGWLEQGYAVLRTDYEGLGTPGPHPYLIGRSEARGILDIVRAARELDPGIGSELVIAGHSQGGQGALFAAQHAPSWAPELDLRGVISYAPASHVREQSGSLSLLRGPSPLSALASMVVSGAATTGPDVDPARILRPEPLELYPRLAEHCQPKLGTPNQLGRLAPAELLRDGEPRGAFAKAVAEMNPAVRIRVPILLAQGGADEVTQPGLTKLLGDELGRLGDDVDDRVYDAADHWDLVEIAADDVLEWLAERLPAG